MIKTTKDYALFVFQKGNRKVDLDKPETRKLAESMVEHGWIPACPLLAKKGRGSKLIVLDGQHRLAIARDFEIPVKYALLDADINPAQFNATSHPWKFADYVSSHAELGNADYEKLIWYSNKYGVSLQMASGILCGKTNSGSTYAPIRSGAWKIKDLEMAINFGECFREVASFHEKLSRTSSASALWACWFVDYFDPSRLIAGLPYAVSGANFFGTRDAVLMIFEAAYNYRHSDKKPLKFDAEAVMHHRKQSGNGSSYAV